MIAYCHLFKPLIRIIILGITFENSVDKNCRNMDSFRIQFSILDYFFDFSDNHFGSSCHICVKIPLSLFKLKISKFVCSFGFYYRKITEKRFLHQIFPAIENCSWFGFWRNLYFKHRLTLSIFNDFSFLISLYSVFYRKSSCLYDGINSCSCVESWYACSSGSAFLSQSSLRAYFQFKFSLEKLSFELCVLTDIRRYHSFYLLVSQQHS